MRTDTLHIPSAAAAQGAKEALRSLVAAAGRRTVGEIRIQVGDPATALGVSVPPEAFELILEVLTQMASGNAVSILPVHAELTTHQAAELLNVSRPYLIGRVEAGKIPFRLVGTHRRIRFVDIMEFKKRDDAARDAAVAELTRQAEDLALGY